MSDSQYGVNSHVAGDSVLEALANAGIKWHRIDFNWNEIEPRDHEHNWSEVDRVVATANRLGLSLLGAIGYTPRWASGSDNIAAPPRDPGRFADFCKEVATRYPAGHLPALSVWNEPNLKQFWAGNREQYLRMLGVCVRALHSAAPDILRVGPDLSSSPNGRPMIWLEQVLADVGGQLDAISYHQYDGGDTVEGRLREIDKLEAFLQVRGFANRPLWITEIGWDRVSPDEQGRLLQGVMRGMQTRPWWDKTFWYDSHGPLWGLVETETAQPKPALIAYEGVISKENDG